MEKEKGILIDAGLKEVEERLVKGSTFVGDDEVKCMFVG